MTTEKKTLLTNEEALDRVKAAASENGWAGAEQTINRWLNDSCLDRKRRNERYYYISGIIDSMVWSGILTFEERDMIIDSLIENEF